MRTIESKFTTISQFSQIFWDYLTIFTEDRWGLLTEIRRLDKRYSHRHSLWIEKWDYRITIASYQRLWNLWMKSQEKRRRKRRRADGGLGSSSLLNFSLKAAQVSVESFRCLWIGVGRYTKQGVPTDRIQIAREPFGGHRFRDGVVPSGTSVKCRLAPPPPFMMAPLP